jgi:hypothetical protein
VVAASARDPDVGPPAVRLATGVGVGVLGNLTTESGSAEEDVDLGPSWGAHLEVRFRLGRVFEIAPSLALTTWNTTGGADRDAVRFLSFDVGPAFFLGFDVGQTRIYFRVPIGFSLTSVDEQRVVPVASSVDDDPGYHFGIGVGALVELGEVGGFFADVGWLRRATFHAVSTPLVLADFDLTGDQAVVRFGIAI